MRCFSFGFFHDEVVDGPFEAVVCFISCRADSKPDVSGGVLGGTSLFGGKGSILPGAVIGILLVTTLMNHDERLALHLHHRPLTRHLHRHRLPELQRRTALTKRSPVF